MRALLIFLLLAQTTKPAIHPKPKQAPIPETVTEERMPFTTLEARPEDWRLTTSPTTQITVLSADTTVAIFLFPKDGWSEMGNLDTRCVLVIPRDGKKLAWLIDRKENTVAPFYYYPGIDPVMYPKWCDERKKK